MKIDKNKVIFISVIGVIVLFMVVYSISFFGGSDEEQEQTLKNTFVPELDQDVVEYNNRLQAVDELKEERVRTAPSIYDERKIDEDGVFDNDLTRKKKQRMIDSIYANGQMDYNKPQSANTTPPQEDWKTVRGRINSEIRESHSSFFESAEIQPESEVSESLGETDPVIYAEINGDQKVMANGRVQMRLTRPHMINGLLYPVNTYVYGFVTFGPNRCFISINHVDQLPASLTVYDYEDGGKGLYVINSFKQDAQGIVIDETVQDVQIPGMRNIRGLKNLFRRSNRNVKVTVVNKYQVLIKPDERR